MGPKPYKFIGFGDVHSPKPYKFIGFGDVQRSAWPGASLPAPRCQGVRALLLNVRLGRRLRRFDRLPGSGLPTKRKDTGTD